jgi:hypothetical protein
MILPLLPQPQCTGKGEGTGTIGGSGRRGGEKDKEKEKEKDKKHRERKGSEVDVTEGSEDKVKYTMQLLFIDKNSLFPTLPSSGKVPADAVTASPKKIKFVSNPIPGSGSSSSAIQPAITTLCECSVVPLNSESRGKYSRIVTLSVQQYLSAMQQERAELLVYRDECLNSGLDPEYPDLKDFILEVYSNNSNSSSGSNNRGNNSSSNSSSSGTLGRSSSGSRSGSWGGMGPVADSDVAESKSRSPSIAGTGTGTTGSINNSTNSNVNNSTSGGNGTGSGNGNGTRSRSNSCWGANAPLTSSATTNSNTNNRTDMQLSRLLQQRQTQQQLHHQGDTEYLPAIAEALMLLREKEVLFEERCVKLGLSAHLLPPPPPSSIPLPISASSTAPASSQEDNASSSQERDRERDGKSNKNRKREKAIGVEALAVKPCIEGGTGTGRGRGRGEGANEVILGLAVGGAGTETGTQSNADLIETTEWEGDYDREKERERERDTQSSSTTASTAISVDRRDAILVSSRLSPTSLPFVPSSSFSSFALAHPAALSAPSDPTVNEQSDSLHRTHTSPQLSPHPSSTPTTPLPPTVPLSPSSSLSLPCTVTSAASTASATASTLYHMFQSPQGDLIFLHPLCTKCLLASVHNDPTLLPHSVSGTVLETEKIRVSASLKQKIPFLRYLPEYCEVIFVELNMKDLVPQEVLSLFQEEFIKRLKKRKEKEKILKKEKKLENDVMYVLCFGVVRVK